MLREQREQNAQHEHKEHRDYVCLVNSLPVSLFILSLLFILFTIERSARA